MGRPRILDKRFCYACGTDKSYINPKGEMKWYLNRGTDLCLCLKCRDKYLHSPIQNPITNAKWNGHKPYDPDKMKIKNARDNPKRFLYKKKRVRLSYDPRTGICSLCNRKVGEGIKKTEIHHMKYHDDDPLKDTIELCARCHLTVVHRKRYDLFRL